MLKKIDIDTLTDTASHGGESGAYYSPRLLAFGRATALVQGAGVTGDTDCRYYNYNIGC